MVALVEMTHEIKIDGWRMEVGVTFTPSAARPFWMSPVAGVSLSLSLSISRSLSHWLLMMLSVCVLV